MQHEKYSRGPVGRLARGCSGAGLDGTSPAPAVTLRTLRNLSHNRSYGEGGCCGFAATLYTKLKQGNGYRDNQDRHNGSNLKPFNAPSINSVNERRVARSVPVYFIEARNFVIVQDFIISGNKWIFIHRIKLKTD